MRIRDILLISPRLNAWSPNIWLPLGLSYIASTLEQEGYVVRLIDLNVKGLRDNKLREEVDKADIVGIGGMITEYSEVLKLSALVRGVDKDKIIILGGGLATVMPREMLEMSPIDFVVMGEGERTIVSLVDAIQNYGYGLADIKGIAYKSNGRVVINEPVEHIACLDAIPFPARHLLDMHPYIMDHFSYLGLRVKGLGNIKSTNLMASRGCPYSCNFCYQGMWGRKVRQRSPQNIIDEMRLLNRSYGVNGFFFLDDIFLFGEKRVMAFCEALKESRLKVAWYCNGRVNLVTKEMLEAMYDAGCRGIAFGFESGSQQILDYIGKGITLSQAKKAAKWARQAGINVVGYFMIGMMRETKTTINETFCFARELNLDFYGFSLVTPLIGTKLHNSVIEAGIVPRETALIRDWTVKVNANLTQDCTDAELADFESRAFMEFYIRRRFGRHYFLNPRFLLAQSRLLLSLRNVKHTRALISKAISLIKVLK